VAEPRSPAEEIVLTHFIVSDDVERSRRFYTDVLGGKGRLLRSGRRTDQCRARQQLDRHQCGFEPLKVGGIGQSSRLEVDGDLHDLVVSPAEARSLICGA
jgi:hypothetical protein